MQCAFSFLVLRWFLPVCLPLVPCALLAADGTADGRAIYEAQCVRCHGRDGQGVDGKHDEPLIGSLTLERLARRIHRTMPEDEPTLCVDDDAAAVATYVYDAFYSPEAQARRQVARVELVRLTNRQYENTVADLLGHFRGSPPRPGEQRGLKAAYFNHRDLRKNDQVEERVDRRIAFEQAGEGLHPLHQGTNGFSARWQGSVVAEETGDYEFVLQTPNGARLWVNDDREELIDAWVASGTENEHRAVVRLLGGRRYPIRLDWFQFKETNASLALEWKPPHGAREIVPSRNLVPDRCEPTSVVTTPFPPDDSSVGYERGVSVSKAWDEAATFAAIEVAYAVVADLDRLSRSKPAESNRTERVKSFCTEFVTQAFRHPLSPEQVQGHVTDPLETAASVEEAVKRVVLLALKSPYFLYLGLGRDLPDDYTVAARLSYGLWDSLPDRQLWKAAEQGDLRSPEAVTRQARRMTDDPRARAKMLSALHHWLQVTQVDSLAKDPVRFPGFTPEIAADLRTSLNLFLEEAVWSGDSDYRELLRADHVFLNARLAEFYGVEAPVGDGFVKVRFEAPHRAGVLTHPYLLSAFSYPRSTSPIHRGVFLTRNIVGRALKPPPQAVAFKDADFDPSMTMREKVAELTRPQACQACHSFINPLGFSLEHFDAVGRYRTEDNDQPVDATGDYTTEEGEVIRLTGARDVAEFAAGSADAQQAFIEQLFHQIVKQPMRAYGADVMPRLHESFVESGCNVQRLLVDIAVLSALHDSSALTAAVSKP